LKIRLVNGKEPYMGKIEVWHDDRWGEVCDHGWDYKGARVVCRMLGYPDAIRFTFETDFNPSLNQIFMDDVSCRGWEKNLHSCKYRNSRRGNCDHYEDVGVRCNAPTLYNHKVTLI
ncbi:predicted protein, partial [Nematostella vectensis]